MEQIQTLNLRQSIDTENKFQAIDIFGQPAPHTKNNGIERNGGITNLYAASESDSLYTETMYCKNGGKVRLKYDPINNLYRAYSGNKEVGLVPPFGVKARRQVLAKVDDAAITEDGTILTTRMRGTVCVIEEYDALDDWIPEKTKEIATEAGILQCFLVRRIDLNYSNADAVVGVYENAGALYFKVFLSAGGSYTITDQGGFLDASQVFAWYDNGYIIASQDPNDRRVFCLSALGVQQGTYTDASCLTARVDWTGGTVLFYGFRNALLDGTDSRYGYSFTPPGANWVIANLTEADISSVTAVSCVPGGIILAYDDAGGDMNLFWSDGPTKEKWEIGHATPPDYFGLIDGEAASDVFIKVHTILGEGAYLSASWDEFAIGVPITEIGEINGKYAPQVQKVGDEFMILYRRGDASYAYILLSDDLDDRLQEIAPGTGKINTISALNVVDTLSNSLQIGGNAFNGFAVLGFTPDPSGEDVQFTAKISAKYGNSVDVGQKIAVDVSDVALIDIPEGLYYSPTDDLVDIYIGTDYYTSIKGSISRISKTFLVDTLYIEDNRIPVPIGSVLTDLTASLLTSTAIREVGYDGYQLANEVPGEYEAFILYGTIYLFDGETIFQARLTSGVIAGKPEEVANARGLIYTASAPTVIYFVSEFDNSLYTFDGGRSVNKSIRFSDKADISEGAYNVKENSLVLVTSDSLIWMRDGIITETAKPYTTFRIFSTEDGIYFASGGVSTRYLYKPVNVITDTIDGGTFLLFVETREFDGGLFSEEEFNRVVDGGTFDQSGSIVALDFQTAFMGQGDNFREVAKKIIFRIYMDTPEEIEVTFTFQAFDQEKAWTETNVFTIGDSGNPFDAEGYAYIEYIPAQQRCVAFSAGLATSAKLWIMDCYVHVESVEKAVIKNKG